MTAPKPPEQQKRRGRPPGSKTKARVPPPMARQPVTDPLLQGIGAEARPRAGKPRAAINADDVERLATIHCSIEEMASFFGVDPRTMDRHLQANAYGPEVRYAFENGRNLGRISLKRLMFQHAQMKNSAGVAAAIHLTKHLLGWNDKALVDPGAGGNVPLEFTFKLDNASANVSVRVGGAPQMEEANPIKTIDADPTFKIVPDGD